MKYRRVYVNGGTYFFTLVTYKRLPLFSSQESVEVFHEAIRYTSARLPFESVAYVILPDHLHIIWTLPEESCDYSTRWRLIKSYFTRCWNKDNGARGSASRMRKKERAVWQRRYWEHLIRDEIDLSHHIEYIHYNPIKHGYVHSLMEWHNSSFLNYVQDGLYPSNWGENAPIWSVTHTME